MPPSPTRKSSKTPHPFDTPMGESIFKALLWVVVILQAVLLGREYNNQHKQLAQRMTPPPRQLSQ